MVCNRLPVIPVFQYDFSLSLSLRSKHSSPISLTVPHTLKTSNPHIFFISSPNRFKQSAKFFSSNPLQNPPIEIFRNFTKWQNCQRGTRAHHPPPLLLATTTTVLSLTLQHHPIHLFPYRALSLYFPLMSNVRGITHNFQIGILLTLNTLTLNSLREKTLIAIKCFKILN